MIEAIGKLSQQPLELGTFMADLSGIPGGVSCYGHSQPFPKGKVLCTVGYSGGGHATLIYRELENPTVMTCVISAQYPLEVEPVVPVLDDPIVKSAGRRFPAVTQTGFDPEIFMHDGTGRLLPATDFLPDKKQGISARNQDGLYAENYAGAVYADGVAAEFTTQGRPCLGWLCDAVRAGLKQIRHEARKKYPKADFLPVTLVDVEQEMMDRLTDEQAALGCMPSFNAYGLHGDLPATGKLLLQRVVGGHIHSGFDLRWLPLDLNMALRVARTCDAIVGVASVALFDGIEHPMRRRYYGLPGEFRLPKHGFEYRTLSNAWLYHPTIMHLVVDLTRAAVKAAWNGLGQFVQAEQQEVIETVQWCDVKQAKAILERNKAFLIALMQGYYGAGTNTAEHAFETFMNGMASKVKDPLAVAANWRLDDEWFAHTHDSRLTWKTQTHAKGLI